MTEINAESLPLQACRGYDCLSEISLNDRLSVTHRNIIVQLTLIAK